jgi:glycosyltransferase involved in cell wall biosynthesis
MRILFVNGQAFLPQLVGGVETSTLDLCLTLKKQGHEPAILCELKEGDLLWLTNRIKNRLLGQHAPRDTYKGLTVYRSWSLKKGLAEAVRREQADAVVVQGALASSFDIAAEGIRLGCKTFYYVHDVSQLMKGIPLPDLTGGHWISNSEFSAAVLKSRLGVESPVVPPLIRAENYRGQSSRRTVTMINPRRIKGGDIAVGMAEQCPEIPFVFVEAWNGRDPDVEELKARVTRLPNATWLPVQGDMRKIYGETRVILAPSQCHETWGRVVTEAHFRGIPAIVSNLGALPETVGAGGLVIAADAPVEQWTAALRSLWSDESLYRQCMDAALAYSARPQIAPEKIAADFVAALQDVRDRSQPT